MCKLQRDDESGPKRADYVMLLIIVAVMAVSSLNWLGYR